MVLHGALLGLREDYLPHPHTTHPLVGSLAGAAQLLKDNAAVPRHAQRGQKPRGEQKGKSVLDRSRQ